jgi:hypothetical protein
VRFLAPAFLIAGIAISLVATPATAAEFKRMPQVDGPDIIVLSGLLQPDDDKKFAAIAAGINQAVIVLNSIGGNNNAAAHIGSFIRSHNYETRVHNGATCNSACVLIWIAGSFRHLDRYARLGVHSASTEREPTGERHEEANRIIAVYMEYMGAPQEMIDLWPLADPCCINYIDYAQAKKWGLLSERPAKHVRPGIHEIDEDDPPRCYFGTEEVPCSPDYDPNYKSIDRPRSDRARSLCRTCDG